MRIKCLLCVVLLASCTTATLSDGKNTVTFKGVKVFSPTVLALRTGACDVPTVDGSGVVSPMPNPPPPPSGPASDPCHTAEMTVNGVDVKSLANIVLTTVVGLMASIATGS